MPDEENGCEGLPQSQQRVCTHPPLVPAALQEAGTSFPSVQAVRHYFAPQSLAFSEEVAIQKPVGSVCVCV
jgi:hypothetical protein